MSKPASYCHDVWGTEITRHDGHVEVMHADTRALARYRAKFHREHVLIGHKPNLKTRVVRRTYYVSRWGGSK